MLTRKPCKRQLTTRSWTKKLLAKKRNRHESNFVDLTTKVTGLRDFFLKNWKKDPEINLQFLENFLCRYLFDLFRHLKVLRLIKNKPYLLSVSIYLSSHQNIYKKHEYGVKITKNKCYNFDYFWCEFRIDHCRFRF